MSNALDLVKIKIPELEVEVAFPKIVCQQPKISLNVIPSIPRTDDCPIARLPRDLLKMIFVNLTEINDINHLEQVCKLFYHTSKTFDDVWRVRFELLWPVVIPLDPDQISYQIQFKFLYRILMQVEDIGTEKQVRSDIQRLRGPNGFNGTIHDYWLQMTAAKNEFNQLYFLLTGNETGDQGALYDFCYLCREFRAALNEFTSLKFELDLAVGDTYDGTEASIRSSSTLGNAWQLPAEVVRKTRRRVYELRGHDGFSGKIDKAWKNLERVRSNFSREITQELAEKYCDLSLTFASKKYGYDRNLGELLSLVGSQYDGADASLEINSILGRHLRRKQYFKDGIDSSEYTSTPTEIFIKSMNEITKNVIISK